MKKKTLESVEGSLTVQLKGSKIHITFDPNNFDILTKTWVFHKYDIFTLKPVTMEMYIAEEVEDWS